MSLETIFWVETFSTWQALIWFFSNMRKCVLIHVNFVLEIHITDTTSKTRFHFVGTYMVLKLRFPSKRLLTFQALIWFLSCMHSHMLLYVTLVIEWLSTYRTLVSTFTCMDNTVTLQVIFWTKAFDTRWAVKGFISSTYTHVSIQISSLWEEYSTCWTLASWIKLLSFWWFLCYFTAIRKVYQYMTIL